MSDLAFVIIYFFYGLAFFSMGLVVALEGGRASDIRLRTALRPLAGFGLIHSVNEWMEMFERIMEMTGQPIRCEFFFVTRLAILAFSFISLAAFGSFLITQTESNQRFSLIVPIFLEAVWVFGLMVLYGRYPLSQMWDVADVWTRYSLAIPASALAAVGLIAQQRRFRQAGMVSFGRDALWASVAFIWYGLVGQIFTKTTPIFPSTYINHEMFLDLFGFPVQILRAASAGVASLFVIRFLRAFQVETDNHLAALQEARIQASEERESLRGELFRRVVAAQESERQRIARDLHDETGQSLTAIGMGLRGLSTLIRGGQGEQVISVLRHLESLVNSALTELQRVISDLRPSHLDDLGLPATLRWYCNMAQERSGVSIRVTARGAERELPPPTKIALFRIAQEAVNNALKHAAPKNINVTIDFELSQVRLAVQDDGSGFDTNLQKRPGRRASLGLIGMQERASLLHGKFALNSLPGRGTLIEVSIPYALEEAETTDEHTPIVG